MGHSGCSSHGMQVAMELAPSLSKVEQLLFGFVSPKTLADEAGIWALQMNTRARDNGDAALPIATQGHLGEMQTHRALGLGSWDQGQRFET